eukprot:4361739-Alexandrium_andersonii.AAC.1
MFSGGCSRPRALYRMGTAHLVVSTLAMPSCTASGPPWSSRAIDPASIAILRRGGGAGGARG